MRVISGTAKGRILKGPPGPGTRPMTDRLKISLFDTLAPYGFTDTHVLDLYAGSGSLGIETLSRGAAWCDFVEQNGAVCAVIRDNLRATGLSDRAHVYKMFVARYLSMLARSSVEVKEYQPFRTDEAKHPAAHSPEHVHAQERVVDKETRYDIILLDPPYADPEIGHTLEVIAGSKLLEPDGLVVIGHRKGVKLEDEYGGGRITRVRHRAMGDSAFSIYEVLDNDARAEEPNNSSGTPAVSSV